MDQRLSLITLGVGDLAASRRFYEACLGWTPAAVLSDVVFYQLPGLALALHPRQALAEDAGLSPGGGGFAGFSLALNLPSPAEVDALADAVRAAGVAILKPPGKTDWGGYHFYLPDPDGFAWEIAFNSACTIHPDGGTVFNFG